MKLKLPAPSVVAERLAKSLGMNLDHAQQKDHKGALYIKMSNGKKIPVIVRKDNGKPTILRGEGEAFDIAFQILVKMYTLAGIASLLDASITNDDLIQPEDFFYVMAEDCDEDQEIQDVKLAKEVLQKVAKL